MLDIGRAGAETEGAASPSGDEQRQRKPEQGQGNQRAENDASHGTERIVRKCGVLPWTRGTVRMTSVQISADGVRHDGLATGFDPYPRACATVSGPQIGRFP